MSRQPYVLETGPLQPLIPPAPASVPGWARATGLLAAGYVAGVHLGVCEDTYKEARYLGAAFVAGALVLIIAASVAAGGRRFGRRAASLAWVCDAVVMVAAFAAFVISRTAGLPAYHHGDWPPIQVVALAAEVAYLGLTVAALRWLRRTR
jgi:hypothetical protein